MKRTGRMIFAALALLCLLAGRILYESRREWVEAGKEIQAGQTEEAIHHLARAIHWYLPGNPYTLKAVTLLWTLGGDAEKRDPKLSLLAYDSLRGSLHAIRSFYWPHKEWILKADDRIAELRAREQAGSEPGLSYEKALEFHRRVLVPDERPRIGWVLCVEAGFFGWILSVLAWIWKGFDREGKMRFRSSLSWMIAMVFFFMIWVIGLARA